MPRTKKRWVAGHLNKGALERLWVEAETQDLTVRELGSRLLESAPVERPDAADERPRADSSSGLDEEAGRATLAYIPVCLRAKGDGAASRKPTRAWQPFKFGPKHVHP
jgi:hypothetical protein